MCLLATARTKDFKCSLPLVILSRLWLVSPLNLLGLWGKVWLLHNRSVLQSLSRRQDCGDAGQFVVVVCVPCRNSKQKATLVKYRVLPAWSVKNDKIQGKANIHFQCFRRDCYCQTLLFGGSDPSSASWVYQLKGWVITVTSTVLCPVALNIIANSHGHCNCLLIWVKTFPASMYVKKAWQSMAS